MTEIKINDDCSKLIDESKISMRDWFAGIALRELIASQRPKSVARQAYEYADAMMKAREE
jgi:hypothetical protein